MTLFLQKMHVLCYISVYMEIRALEPLRNCWKNYAFKFIWFIVVCELIHGRKQERNVVDYFFRYAKPLSK